MIKVCKSQLLNFVAYIIKSVSSAVAQWCKLPCEINISQPVGVSHEPIPYTDITVICNVLSVLLNKSV